ncbi:hypothetical protein CKO23_03360 [Thiocystis violacea]|nr:DUF2802 domain-containing protein [Thiocystis violacea]MBK1721291.1 hypothetical protein [Thiocystis violacea]
MDPLWILVGVLALGLILALSLAILALRAVRSLRQQVREIRRDQQRQSTTLLALHGAMKVISEDVITHGQHQSSVTRALERLSDRQSELSLRDVDEGLYSHAIELIRHGKSREEVRKFCALTHSEVDLLFSLHAQGAGPPQRN